MAGVGIASLANYSVNMFTTRSAVDIAGHFGTAAIFSAKCRWLACRRGMALGCVVANFDSGRASNCQ